MANSLPSDLRRRAVLSSRLMSSARSWSPLSLEMSSMTFLPWAEMIKRPMREIVRRFIVGVSETDQKIVP